VHRVLATLRGAVWHGQRGIIKEWTGRPSTLPKRLLRNFSSLHCILPLLLAFLLKFPPVCMDAVIKPTWAQVCRRANLEAPSMCKATFVMLCESTSMLIHNNREAKLRFIKSGGLISVVHYARVSPESTMVQSAVLAIALALSARSEDCIRLLVKEKVQDIAVAAFRRFPGNDQITAIAAGLLANMSNVRCVRPDLRKCGVMDLANDLLLLSPPEAGSTTTSTTSSVTTASLTGTSAAFVQDFVQYMQANLEKDD